MEKTLEHLLEIDDSNVIIKRYKIRRSGKGSVSIETTIPREVFERDARKLGMDPEKAIERLAAVWRYNSFNGLHLSFEPRES